MRRDVFLMMELLFDRVGNIVAIRKKAREKEKKKNLVTSILSFFYIVFSASHTGSLKVEICEVKG